MAEEKKVKPETEKQATSTQDSQIIATLLRKFNLNASLKPVDADFIYRNQYLAKAEATIANALLDYANPLRRETYFSPQREYEFFVVVRKSSWTGGIGEKRVEHILVGIAPEELIGFGDGDFFVPPPPPAYPQKPIERTLVRYTCPEESAWPVGGIVHISSPRPKGPEWQFWQATNYSCISAAEIRVRRSTDGIVYTLLALFSLRLSSLHYTEYSIEMAAEEVYSLEMASRPDYLTTLDMPAEHWVPTVPQPSAWLSAKYKGTECVAYCGRLGNHAIFLATDKATGRILPLAFFKSPLRPFAITFPTTPTTRLLLDNLDCIKEGEPVYMTEYPALCHANHEAEATLLGFLGERSIPKTDFGPLAGKHVIYLEIPADDDAGPERAHRVALKTFARAYEQGNRNFTAWIEETRLTIPMEDLLKEAREQGYLEDEGSVDRSARLADYLAKWPKSPDQGKPIVGRLVKAGRCVLIYADPGVGKTLFCQVVATVAYQRKSLDSGCFQYTWDGSRQCRVLYIQNEMDQEEFEVRQNSLDQFLHVSGTKVEYYTPEDSLTDLNEQIAVLKKLEALDPQGQYQWLVCFDSVKTIMPDAEFSATFNKKVSPFVRLLKAAGCSVVILHHSNLQGKESGGVNMNVTNNYKIHLEQVMEHNGHKEVRVSVEKKRDLTGNEGASAIWQWTVDAAKVISEFSSSYDDEAALPAATPAPALPAASAEAAPPLSSETCAPMEALPKTWDELKALPSERQADALHALWNQHGTIPKVAQYLNASLSSLEKLKHRLNIGEASKAAYLAAKAGNP